MYIVLVPPVVGRSVIEQRSYGCGLIIEGEIRNLINILTGISDSLITFTYYLHNISIGTSVILLP